MATRPIITEAGPNEKTILDYVCDTAIHILKESYFAKSPFWPKNGFEQSLIPPAVDDCISYHANDWPVNEYGFKGDLFFKIHHTTPTRKLEQMYHIELILDCAITDDLYFTERKSAFRDQGFLNFRFTYTPQ